MPKQQEMTQESLNQKMDMTLEQIRQKLQIPKDTPVKRLQEIMDSLLQPKGFSMGARVGHVDQTTGAEKRPRRSGHSVYLRDDAWEFLQYAAKKAGVKPGRLLEDLIKCLWMESK